MLSFSKQLLCFNLFVLLFTIQSSANNTVYEQRKDDYVDSSLASPSGGKLILQAYRGVPLDTILLNSKLSNISTGVTSDFDIIELVRICFLTNGAYDSKILPVLNSVPYWINNGDTVRNYWSENHMIMWMSSDWLLHERYGRSIDNTLDARLRHYLNLKVQYGFYEFFSSVYNPYSLSGLLNLADFAQDAQIKSLARQAAQRLLTDLLMMTTDKGVFFPTAGRNYPGKYESTYGQNHNNLIFLLTGLGEAPHGASAAGPFLASSVLPVDTIINSWNPVLDTLYHMGHSLDSGFIINSNMSQTDKVIFQWSSGAYFHPAVVQSTIQLLIDSNMWGHVDFALLRPLAGAITPQSAPALAEGLGCISKSSVISGEDISIFRHNSVSLASVADFWKGKVGFQQHPCVATIGTTAVYTGSGEVKPIWDDRNPNNANVHLPYIKQKKNVALLMYRPEKTPPLLGPNYAFKEVALHWTDADFDEIVNDSLWLIGRQEQSYVAVRRSCIGEINTVRACVTNGGQSWVIIVGDSGMYNSFSDFQDMVHLAQFEEKWYLDSVESKYVYYSKIVADSITLEYAWGVDSTIGTGFNNEPYTDVDLTVFPNPANDIATLNLSSFLNQSLEIKVINILGQEVYFEKIENLNTSHKNVAVADLTKGLYLISIETRDNRLRGKFIKQE